jgi:hypothetical protein
MPASVAKCGYDAMSRSEFIAINEKPLAFMLNRLSPFLPRRAVLKMIERMQRK